MQVKIVPHSSLLPYFSGEQKEFSADLNTYSDVVSYLDNLHPKFGSIIRKISNDDEISHVSILDKEFKPIPEGSLLISKCKEGDTLYIVPTFMGAKGKAGKIFAFVAILALTVATAGASTPFLAAVHQVGRTLLVNVGLALLARMFNKKPQKDQSPDQRGKSSILNGLQITTSPGTPIPLHFGEVRVAGHLITGYIDPIIHGQNDVIRVGSYFNLPRNNEFNTTPKIGTPSSVTEQNENVTIGIFSEYTYQVIVSSTPRYEHRDGSDGSGYRAIVGYDRVYETRTGRTYHDLYSTDIGYATLAIGEGPLYRIMPEGPQSIELNDSSIDSLINLDGDGDINTDEFVVDYRTGTDNQTPMQVFNDSVVIPKYFPSRVSLKKGTHSPPSSVEQQATTAQAWDQIRFNFIVSQLFSADDKGNTNSHSMKIRIRIYDSSGRTLIPTDPQEITINGKVTTEVKISRTVTIPKEHADEKGYTFNITKVSEESNSPKVRDDIHIIGWDEIEKVTLSYPSTALVGYAIKSTDQFSGGIPRFTTTIKGLIIDVPSNYNQPIIPRTNKGSTTYEIDWRNLETNTEARSNSAATTGGVILENASGTILTGSGTLQPNSGDIYTGGARNPPIYLGIWDGKFKKAWSQNPIWIIYYLLTNERHGLGIPSHNIDKYNFYKAAQYCDNCDPHYGRFKTTVKGQADGSYRHKLRGTKTDIRDTLVGDSNDTRVDQRRFICDLSIEGGESTIDVLNQITAAIRGVLTYSSGKIIISMDMENEQPVMHFNETNIKEKSISISGNRESDTVTGIEAAYIDPNNSFKGDVVKVDSAEQNDGRNLTGYENITSLELKGVTRRSQALRFCQYQVASSRYQRRNIKFTTGPEAINLSIGDPIAVSILETGVSYGYGGRLASSIEWGQFTGTINLEYFTSPPLTEEFFAEIDSSSALILKITSLDNDKTEYYEVIEYALQTSLQFNTGNASFGIGLVNDLEISRIINPITGSRTIYPLPSSGLRPTFEKGDIWTLGIISASNYTRHEDYSDKLFKIIGIEKDLEEFTIDISAEEYISNLFSDSDKYIQYNPPNYKSYQPAYRALSIPSIAMEIKLASTD